MAWEVVDVRQRGKDCFVAAYSGANALRVSSVAYKMLGKPKRIGILRNPTSGLLALRPAQDGNGYAVNAKTGALGSPRVARLLQLEPGRYPAWIEDGMLVFRNPAWEVTE